MQLPLSGGLGQYPLSAVEGREEEETRPQSRYPRSSRPVRPQTAAVRMVRQLRRESSATWTLEDDEEGAGAASPPRRSVRPSSSPLPPSYAAPAAQKERTFVAAAAPRPFSAAGDGARSLPPLPHRPRLRPRTGLVRTAARVPDAAASTPPRGPDPRAARYGGGAQRTPYCVRPASALRWRSGRATALCPAPSGPAADHAALRIQTAWRARMARRARRLKASVRGAVLRKQVARRARRAAARRIWTAWVAHRARRPPPPVPVPDPAEAAARIQAWWLSQRACRRILAWRGAVIAGRARREGAARCIARSMRWRARRAGARGRARARAAARIQALVRGHSARMLASALRAHARVVRRRRAAAVIQRAWRQRQLHQRFGRRRQQAACMRIQRAWRYWKLCEQCARKRSETASTCIQCAWRCWRLRQRCARRREEAASVRIQHAWRCWRARRRRVQRSTLHRWRRAAAARARERRGAAMLVALAWQRWRGRRERLAHATIRCAWRVHTRRRHAAARRAQAQWRRFRACQAAQVRRHARLVALQACEGVEPRSRRLP